MPERRFAALRFIATVYKVLGGLVVLAALVLFGYILYVAYQSYVLNATATLINNLYLALATLAGGALASVVLFASGQLIDLLLAIEENTRVSASLLRKY